MVEEFWVVDDANKDFLAGDSCALNFELLKSDDDVVVVWDEYWDFVFIVLLDENNWLLLLPPNDAFCIGFR